MKINVAEISGVGNYCEDTLKIGEETVKTFHVGDNLGKVFLVVRKNTIEVRTDRKLGQLLSEKYESVMESRYFGRGGIEIVNSNQLAQDEIDDLVRLSYNLSSESK